MSGMVELVPTVELRVLEEAVVDGSFDFNTECKLRVVRMIMASCNAISSVTW